MQDHRFIALDNDGVSSRGEEPHPFSEEDRGEVYDKGPDLARDPARGDKILPQTLEEASVALMAEHLEVFETVRRESSGSAEFVDEKGQAWDVKSPVSPPPEQGWFFAPEHHLGKIREDFDQGDRVLLNLSRCNEQDSQTMIEHLNQSLTQDEKGRLLILCRAA